MFLFLKTMTLQDWIVPITSSSYSIRQARKRSGSPRAPDVDRPTKRHRTCQGDRPLLQLPQGLAVGVLRTSNTFDMWCKWLQTSRHNATIARLPPVLSNTIFPLSPTVLTAIRTKGLDPRLVSQLSFLTRYNCPTFEVISIKHLAPFTSLTSLHLELYVAGEDMSPIGDLRSLTKLSLQGQGYFLDDEPPYLDFTWMGHLTNLKSLDLTDIPEGSDLQCITLLPVLEALKLSSTEWYPVMWRSLTQITKLSLAGVLDTSDQPPTNLAALACLTNLNELHLQELFNVTHLDVLSNFTELQKLTLVQMSYLTSISGAVHCPTLKSLQVDDCTAIDMDMTQFPLALERIILTEVNVRNLSVFAPLPHLKVLMIYTLDPLFCSQPQLQSPHMVEYRSQIIASDIML